MNKVTVHMTKTKGKIRDFAEQLTKFKDFINASLRTVKNLMDHRVLLINITN